MGGITAGQPQFFPFADAVQFSDHRQKFLAGIDFNDRKAGLRVHVDDLADRPFEIDNGLPRVPRVPHTARVSVH